MTTSQLIQQLRACLGQGAGRDRDEAQRLARMYADACRQASERLGQSASYLSKSMVSESLQVAESDPPLLDLIAQLDFMGSEDWRVLCSDNGWSVPSGFDDNQIAQLNGAYESSASIEPMLKQFRRSVREKHTADCIRILRGLVHTQPDNENWKADLASFEQHRLQEIRGAVPQLIESADEGQLSRIAAELACPWSVGDVSDIAAEVKAGLDRLQAARELKSGLYTLAAIDAAYLARDADLAGPAIGECQRLLQSPLFRPDSNSLAKFEKAQQWYKSEMRQRLEKQEYERAVAQLQVGVEERDLKKIEEAFIDLARSPSAPPEKLELLGRDMLEDARLARERRHKRAVAAGLLFVVGITAVAGIFYLLRQREAIITNTENELQLLFDAADLDGFQSRLNRTESARPWLYRHKRIQVYVERLPQLTARVAERVAECESLLLRLEALRDNSFVNVPEDINIEELFDRARDLASTGSDLNRITDVYVAWNTELENRQRDRDAAALAILSQVEESLQQFTDHSSTLSEHEASDSLESARRSITEALAVSELSEGVKIRGESLKDQISAQIARVKARQRMAGSIERATTLSLYFDALTLFAEAFPTDPLTQSIKKLTPLRSAINDLTLLRSSRGPQSVFWREIHKYTTDFEPDAIWPSIQSRLMELENDRMMTDLYFATIRGETTYFLGQPRRDSEERQGVVYQVFGGQIYTPARQDKRPQFAFRIVSISPQNMRRMAHCDCIAELVAAVQLSSADSAVDVLLEQISILQRRNDINALLRLQLVTQLVKELERLGATQGIPHWQLFLSDAGRIPADLHWLCTANTRVIAATAEADKILLNNLSQTKVFKQTVYRKTLIDQLSAIQFVWAGHAALEQALGTINWIITPQPVEYYVVRLHDNGEPYLRLVRETINDELKQYGSLRPGEPLFQIRNGESLRDIFNQSARAAHIRGSEDVAGVQYPPIVPTNLRP
jgi:hypothetical protein